MELTFKDSPRFHGYKIIEANRESFVAVSPYASQKNMKYQRMTWSYCADDVQEFIQARVPGWLDGNDWQHPDFDQVKDQVVNKYYK